MRDDSELSSQLCKGLASVGQIEEGCQAQKESANCRGVGLLACTPPPCRPCLPAQPMNATSAFGPNLRYIVKWRRRETRESWNNVTVWGSRYVVGQTPVYVPYEIRVQAENDFGKGPEPDTVIGYSGEDCEYPPPSPTWDPVSWAPQGHPQRPGISGWVLGLPRPSWEDSTS